MPVCFEIRNLTIRYPNAKETDPVIDRVSLQLLQNQTLAVVGESGCGKTTLLRTILRTIPSESFIEGTIKLGDVSLFDLNEQEMNAIRREKIAMIYQDPQRCLDPTMRVGAQIEEVVRLRGIPSDFPVAKRTDSLLQSVGFEHPETVRRKYPHQLSGGQCQRIMIAIALAGHPGILLADEPTSALDLLTQKQIIRLISDLRAENKLTVMFVTHDLSLAQKIADDIAVMYKGRIVESGPIDEVMSRPYHPYTRELLRSVPERISVSAETCPDDRPVNPTADGSCPYRAACRGAALECRACQQGPDWLLTSHWSACTQPS